MTILGLFVYKSLPALPDRKNPDPDNGSLIAGYKVRHDLRGVPEILSKHPGSVFVNGWDYRVHSYLGLPSVRGELPWLMAGAVHYAQYVQNIVDRQFDYVLDITGRTGLIVGNDHSLSGSGPLGRMGRENYTLIYDSNGLRLYQRHSACRQGDSRAVGCS